MALNLDSIYENVLKLLKDSEHLRNCDICLIFNYWLIYDGETRYMSVEGRHNLTSAESIRRVRQKIQSMTWVDKEGNKRFGMYLPTDEEVRKKRKIAEEAYRIWSLQ